MGEAPINSMEDSTSNTARICKEFFPTSLRSVLEEGQWPFATIETPVQQVSIEPYAKEQKFVYRIPGDCAIILDLYQRLDRMHEPKRINWDIRYIPELKASAIICDKKTEIKDNDALIDQDEQVVMKYISDTQTTYSYSASFIKCVSAQLAADMCMAITHDPQRMQLMFQYAEDLKAKSLRNALNEDKQDKVHFVDQFTASREGRLC